MSFFNRDVSVTRTQVARRSGYAAGALAALLLGSSAQAALVSACTGASLPRSALTSILTPLVTGILTPLSNIPLIGAGVLAGVNGIVSNAVAGGNISLSVVNLAPGGGVLTPADANSCATTSDSFQLDNAAGIAIGGNTITGLGGGLVGASAGTIGSIAFGNAATTGALATNSIAIGNNASVLLAPNSVAIGNGSTAVRGAQAAYLAPGLVGLQSSSGEFSVGSALAPRQITNVAPGSAPTDAVNLAQVSSAILNSANGAPVQYSNPLTPTLPNGGVVTNSTTLVGLVPGTPVALHNVAPGAVNALSTDAVNGGQLFVTNTAVDLNVTNTLTNTTNIAANTTLIAGANVNIATNTTAITNLNNGTAGIVRQVGGAPGGGTITVGAQTAGTLVDFTGTAGIRRLTGIQAGILSAASTDAINGSQLFTTNTNVTNNTNSITNISTGINNGTLGLVQQVGGAPGAGIITVGAGTQGTILNVSNSTGGTRTITGVTAGINPTDAVNVSQLIGFTSAGANAVLYDTVGAVRLNAITLIGGVAGPVTIRNVAPGNVAAGSTEAVNGGQLFTTNGNVTNNTTNIAGNTTSITNLNNGTAGLVRQVGSSPGSGLITVGAETAGTNISVAGTAGPRVISGVAAGSAPTDAVNFSQLASVGAGNANAVLYDTAGGVRQNSITLTGGAAGPVTITNLKAGALNATSTDAVNGAQLFATNQNVATNTTNITNLTTTVNANTTAITNIQNGTSGIVQQTGGSGGPITVGVATGGMVVDVTGTGGTRTVTGVTAGAVTAGSTDAVNGAQLFATNGQVTTNTTNIATNTSNIATNTTNIANNTTAIAGNTTAITNLSTNIDNGTVGLVQQTGGAPGNGQITVGATTGGTSISVAGSGGDRIITGVAPGLAANDAATVGQLASVVGGSFNAVQYDTDGGGGRLNSITLTGGTAAPVTIGNVGPGALTTTSLEAVNGSQLAATNATVTNIVNGNAGAFRSDNTAGVAASSATGANASSGGFGASASGARSLALGNSSTSSGTNSVALGAGSTDGGQANVVSVGSVGGERRLTNVGPGTSGTDAVNLAQLQAQSASFATTTNSLQTQINGLDFDLSRTKRRANAGTAGAMAVAALPQPFTEGAGMIGGAMGYWQGQVAFAVGVSKIVSDKAIVKAGAAVSGRGTGGFNAGVGFQF